MLHEKRCLYMKTCLRPFTFIFEPLNNFFNIAGIQINVVKKWSHVPNYLYMVWGGIGHIAVVLFFPAIGLRLQIFQDYDVLGNSRSIN